MSFLDQYNKAKTILVIADNVGETVLDRLLLETFIGKEIIYTVRVHLIINDATITDAYDVGINNYAKVISSGTSCPGTVLHTCSQEFLNYYKDADLVISKGQGNFKRSMKRIE